VFYVKRSATFSKKATYLNLVDRTDLIRCSNNWCLFILERRSLTITYHPFYMCQLKIRSYAYTGVKLILYLRLLYDSSFGLGYKLKLMCLFRNWQKLISDDTNKYNNIHWAQIDLSDFNMIDVGYIQMIVLDNHQYINNCYPMLDQMWLKIIF
jgi:hypothetical protein